MDIAIAIIIYTAIQAIVYFCIRFYKNKNNKIQVEDEIISMVNESHSNGLLEENEAMLIGNIFETGDKQAKDVMTDRSNIVAIDGDMTLGEAMDVILSQNKSRFPVFEENLDHISGILHLKDAVRLSRISENIDKKILDLSELLFEPRFIPETRGLYALFQTMQEDKLQMVIVVDEYGQTVGLVAMEDIIEELVGNILDEYDEDEGHIVEHGEDKYVIDGFTRLEELENRLGISFGEQEFETINGYLISLIERIPDDKTRFSTDVGEYNFKLLSVENNCITQVLVTKINKEKEDVRTF